MKLWPTWAFLAAVLCGEAQAQQKVLVFKGARILTANEQGKVFDPGTMVVEQGKISAIGPDAEITVPDGAEVLDLKGKVLIPGLVDTHSHLGVYSRPLIKAHSDGNEMTGPVQTVVRALDAVNPFDPGIRMALAGGVTTANIMPGSGNVIGGQTLYVKLRGRTVEQMWIPAEGVLGGLKMANGENPKRSYGGKGQAPATRMKVASLQRAEFIKAQEYAAKWEQYRRKLAAKEEATPPTVDLALEPLLEVLQKKRTVHFHTHRADDIMTTLRLADEFGFELVVQHGTEAFKIAPELAKRKVPVSMTVIDSPGGKAEVVDFMEETGAELTKAGVKVIVNTDDFITESRFMLRTTAITVRGGLDETAALKAVTLYPAQAMHLDNRLGSLEKGKDADFAILSGAPFAICSRVLATYIEGQKMFDLTDPQDRLYQVGGFALADAKLAPPDAPLLPPLAKTSAPTAPANRPEMKADAKEFAILAARVHTVSKGTIEDGAVLVRDGKIAYVGPRKQLDLKAGVPVLTAAEVSPGLIDAHSVVPLAGEYNIAADQDANESTDPNQADVRVLDAFNPQEPLLRFLLEQGVTVIHATPGRDNAIAGLTGVFHTHATTAESAVIRFPQAMMFNLGETAKDAYPGKRPGTRMGTAALLRTALSEAASYLEKQKKAKDDPPARNLKHEAVGLAIEGKISSLFCAQRSDDLLTALRLSDEFKLKPVLALAAEAYLVKEQLAQAKVPVIVHPTMQRVAEMETYHSCLLNASALQTAGLTISIGSAVEGYVPKTRVVRHEAGMAMVYGLGFDRALHAITLGAAQILNVEDRYGSLEVGKTADLVLYDGHPFEHTTHVTHVIVNGGLVHDRATRSSIPFALRFPGSLPEIPCCLGW